MVMVVVVVVVALFSEVVLSATDEFRPDELFAASVMFGPK